jgi:flagellar basal-body rod modification protein FlgD
MAEISSPPPLYSSSSVRETAAQMVAKDREAKDAKAALSSDFDTFLKMLTVQVQNQDPLNPVDSTDYATQLATFSSVEQQVLTNDLLRAMSGALGGNALQEMSGWIGMEALARAPALFTGTPIAIRPDVAEGAETAALVVRNSDGDVVQRFALETDQEEVFWAGTDETGTALPNGAYRFDVESYKGEDLFDTRQAEVYSRIAEVRKDGDSVILRLADGTETDPDLINALRAPQI